MNRYLTMIAIAAVLALPVPAGADSISYEESWAFLYEFPLQWQGGAVSQADRYYITTGDASEFVPGTWSLVIRNAAQQQLARYLFNPITMGAGGPFSLKVPTEGSGASAVIIDGNGIQTAAFDLLASRVCNDNGMCESQAGERRENCTADCVAVAEASADSLGAASIGTQLPVGARLGSLMLRFSGAVAAVMLLAGIARVLDSRKRP